MPPRKHEPVFGSVEAALQEIVTPSADDESEREADDDISDLIGGDDDFDVQLAIPEPGEQVLHSFLCVGGPWGSAMYTVANKSRGDIPVTVYGAKGFYRFEKDPERGTVLKWNLYPNVTDAEARTHYGLSHYE